MESLKTYFISMHDIDLDQNTMESVEIGNYEELENYIAKVMERRLNDPKSKHYKIRNESTRVISNVLNIKDDVSGNKTYSEDIASHLLGVEKDVDDEMKKIFTSVRRGVLVQSLLEYQGELLYLMTKIELDAFLHGTSFVKLIGLPYEKHVLKSCLIKFVKNPGIGEILLYDSNPKIANYWWNTFLELDEIRSKEYNTSYSFNVIKKALGKKVGKKSVTDYSKLVDKLRGYYNNNENYDHEEMIHEIFDNYEPLDKGIDLEKVKESISPLPEKRKFDHMFPVALDQVEQVSQYTIPVAPMIDVILNDSIDALRHLLCIYTDPAGQKYLQIQLNDNVSLPGIPGCN